MFSEEYQKPRKKLDQKTAKLKAADFCAYQERSQQEVRDKLYSYGLHKAEVEDTISQLITENFINEERFAIAYVGGKFRLKKWGRKKILNGLKYHKVSNYCLNKAFAQIEDEEYKQTILELIEKKIDSISEENEFRRNNKVVQYLMQKGFETDIVWALLKK